MTATTEKKAAMTMTERGKGERGVTTAAIEKNYRLKHIKIDFSLFSY
jgi:hypothetical protein